MKELCCAIRRDRMLAITAMICRNTRNLRRMNLSSLDLEAEGRDSGTVIWRCATKTGDEFDCRPIGSMEHRKALFQNAKANVGKMLTIKYQELSEKGIPRFLSGKSIRDGF